MYLFFCRISAGFLLTEFIIAFAVLSLYIVICAHVFFSTVYEYTRAKQRLHLFTLVQNNIEFSWSGSRGQKDFIDDRITRQILPVEKGIVLPSVPKLKQEWLEINVTCRKGQSPQYIRLRGWVREE